jgi:hypothetical protein
MTNRVVRLRAEGRCTSCGGENLRFPKWLCATCVHRALVSKRVTWARRRKNHLCTRCGQNPVTRFVWCLTCRTAHADQRHVFFIPQRRSA